MVQIDRSEITATTMVAVATLSHTRCAVRDRVSGAFSPGSVSVLSGCDMVEGQSTVYVEIRRHFFQRQYECCVAVKA